MNEIWRHDFWSENTSSDVSHFSVTITRTRVLSEELHATFLLLLSENWFKHLFPELFFEKLWFYRRMRNRHLVFFYKSKYAFKLQVFAIKNSFINMTESREFRWANDAKIAQDVHFTLFLFLRRRRRRRRKQTNKQTKQEVSTILITDVYIT